ncbi:hypothetical protein [Ornithinibacillus halotolerans]|uniref:Uncharacterized protein n=1 Tax=Ornithinibacillus halotolerans TaxID=1274357 RepID=A0A916S4A3_9BACI|nr:hypothetical protein [Ornithinibacillus halotolerans]GGA80417.1 hypothetical protein GCM10008025_24770 [Ornithinibacillus halotolerans]
MQQKKFQLQRGYAGTDAKKVRKEIQEDLKRGQGAMTAREAGAMRD